MAAKKIKYYAVVRGHRPGIYTSWAECQQQLSGFSQPVYKSFENQAQAAYFIEQKQQELAAQATIQWESLSVDAACSGNPGVMEYRGVYTKSGLQLFISEKYQDGTNNIGEFLAIVHALAFLQKQGQPDFPIYTDSLNAISWVNKKKANTKLERTSRNAKLFHMIERAEAWLRSHTYRNPVLKWNTAEWGEIKADFGRK